MENTNSSTRKCYENIINNFGLDLSMNDTDTLKDVIHNIVSGVEELSETFEEIDDSTEILLNAISNLKHSCNSVINYVAKALYILELFCEISTDTDSNDLNIVAATIRNRQKDCEFAIVADEIQKISTSRAVMIISNLLKAMLSESDKMLTKIEYLSEQTLFQAIAAEQIPLWLKRLSISTKQLSKMAEKP